MWENLGKLTMPAMADESIALIDCLDFEHPRVYTHHELDRLTDACARGLLRQGLKRGDSIALMGVNRAEFLIAYLAIMRAGMVAVPVNYKLTRDVVEFILKDCGAKLLFVDAERQKMAPTDIATHYLEGSSWDSFLEFGSFETVIPDDDECAMILYTSGSTGKPKGVQLSHSGQIWALRSRFLGGKSFESERFLIAAPLFHMNALTSFKFSLSAHASTVLLPSFDVKKFIQAIGRHNVTWITAVPTMMAMVVREKEELSKIDTSNVRYVRMGSAPATAQLYASVQHSFPNATLAGGYGTTEAGPIVFGPRKGQDLPAGGGLGWPLQGVEVRLIDPQGRDSDEEGELWMRTPANMTRYINLPEKTDEVLTQDGWYKSGDIFRRDDLGCYYFVGRVDDMFVCNGENIYPGEVEQLLTSMPGVLQAAIVPVADEIRGFKPVAFIVCNDDADIDEESVKQYALANGPAYQHPRRVHFIDMLPIASTNKIDRKKLITQALNLESNLL